ncbi:hypothetical protein AB4Z21_14490 [Paenibacillus sp. MCAF20]
MLSDDARKVLAVLWSLNRYGEFKVDMKELRRKSQRTEPQVRDALNELYKEGYLLWDKLNGIFRLLYSSELEKRSWKY